MVPEEPDEPLPTKDAMLVTGAAKGLTPKDPGQ